MANTTELPNPFTPLAFLNPALADQFEVSRYLYAATLGAYIWDIGLNLGNDYALLCKHRIRFPTVVYFLSRAFTLAYILTSFVFQVAPVRDCAALQLSLGICLLLSQVSTAMLFFLRATAVWHPNKIAFAMFFILWLGVSGAYITVPLGLRGAHIGPTMQCINTTVPEKAEAAVIMCLINDTVIFLAINYRIMSYTIVADSPKDLIRAFFGGRQLSTLSRALVRSGQHFYLVAVCANIVFLTLFKIPNVSPAYHAMVGIPAFTLINAMSCLVFRKIKFGLITADGTMRATSIDFHTTPNPRSISLSATEPLGATDNLGANQTLPLGVRVPADNDEFGDGIDGCQETLKTQMLA